MIYPTCEGSDVGRVKLRLAFKLNTCSSNIVNGCGVRSRKK